MKIYATHNVKGRGWVTVVDTTGVPKSALKIGILVHLGDHAWKLKGMEAHSGGGITDIAKRIGLILVPEGDAPDVPECGKELEL